MNWREWLWPKTLIPRRAVKPLVDGADFHEYINADSLVMPIIPTPEEVSLKHGGRTRRVVACLTDIRTKLNDQEWLHNNFTYQFCSVVYLQDEEVELVINQLRKAGWDVEWEYKLSAARHFFTLRPRSVG